MIQKIEFDGGSLVRPESAALINADTGEELVVFKQNCFDPATADFLPEVAAAIKKLAEDL